MQRNFGGAGAGEIIDPNTKLSTEIWNFQFIILVDSVDKNCSILTGKPTWRSTTAPVEMWLDETGTIIFLQHDVRV